MRVQPNIRWLVVVILLFLLYAFPAFAQIGGGAIQYGMTVIGQLDSSAPLLYTFEGAAGDMIRARLLGGSGGLNPSLALVDAANNVILNSDDDPLAGSPTDASLAYVLPDTAFYGLRLSAADGTAGEYLLQMIRETAPESTLPFGEPVSAELSADAPLQRFGLSPDASCENALSVVNSAGDSVPFAVRVIDPTGHVIAQGSGAGEQRYILSPDSQTFAVDVAALYAGAYPTLTLTFACADDLAACASPAADSAPFPEPTFAPPAGRVLTVQSGGEIRYGTSLMANLFEGSGLISYMFMGEAGDTVTAEALSFAPGSDPALVLLTSSMLPVAFNEDDAFPFAMGDSRLSVVLPESGLYALILTSDERGGTFWVRLSGGQSAGVRAGELENNCGASA